MGDLYFVYILINAWNRVLYTGVTGDLKARIYQHREKLLPGFTSRYNVWKLVYYETAMMRPAPLPARSRSRPVHVRRKSS